MKKQAILTILIFITLCCLFAFTSCERNGEVSVAADQNKESQAQEVLVMDKRYISESHVRSSAEKQIYYVFHSDGAGEYIYHYDYDYISDYDKKYDEHIHRHYAIHFKYTYVDRDKSAVVCFYDSIERFEGDDGSYKSTSWSELITVSENVLSTIGSNDYVFWINEDYLKTIPNYRK